MPRFRFSLRTLILVLVLIIVCFAILANRVRQQQIAVFAILNAGGVVFLSPDPLGGGVSDYIAIRDYRSHWYRSVARVILYPNDEHSTKTLLELTAKIPGLTQLIVLPDKKFDVFNRDSENAVTDEEIESIARLLPNLKNLVVAPAKCSKSKGTWLESQMPSLESGSIVIVWNGESGKSFVEHKFN